jgi:hypothetical protein
VRGVISRENWFCPSPHIPSPRAANVQCNRARGEGAALTALAQSAGRGGGIDRTRTEWRSSRMVVFRRSQFHRWTQRCSLAPCRLELSSAPHGEEGVRRTGEGSHQ